MVPTARGAEVSAAGAIVMDAASGRVLWEKDSHTPRPVASVTKLMTALVALESGRDLEEPVTIRPEWVGAEGSSLYLKAGERVTLEGLLYGMLLRSGNDGALAVAGTCGGSVEDFVARMNRRAAALGMAHTRFADPCGLNDAGVSSAYDLALLARACLQNDTLAEMVATRTRDMDGRVLVNHNKLLWRYQGCIGMKTGYTKRAGRTLVSAARREGLTLICVTLNDGDDWADHAALLDGAFARYHSRPLVQAGETVAQLPVRDSLLPVCPVTAAADASVALAEGETAERRLEWDTAVLTAPVPDGVPVGTLVCTVNGREVARVPLTASGAGRDVLPARGWRFWER